MKIIFVHHILLLGRWLAYVCIYWIENALLLLAASSPLGRFKNKTGQADSAAQMRSTLCCSYRATGPAVKAMTAWFFRKRARRTCLWSIGPCRLQRGALSAVISNREHWMLWMQSSPAFAWEEYSRAAAKRKKRVLSESHEDKTLMSTN